jgi:hypothetical protein
VLAPEWNDGEASVASETPFVLLALLSSACQDTVSFFYSFAYEMPRNRIEQGKSPL